MNRNSLIRDFDLVETSAGRKVNKGVGMKLIMTARPTYQEEGLDGYSFFKRIGPVHFFVSTFPILCSFDVFFSIYSNVSTFSISYLVMGAGVLG